MGQEKRTQNRCKNAETYSYTMPIVPDHNIATDELEN